MTAVLGLKAIFSQSRLYDFFVITPHAMVLSRKSCNSHASASDAPRDAMSLAGWRLQL
jgi:hypothetical protein